MASKLYDFRIAGFTAAGNITTGAGALASQPVELWSDGSIVFTDLSGNRRRLHESPELSTIFDRIFRGTGGVDTAKTFNK